MNTRKQQTGSMLLEALIALLIFSLGILAVTGLQAASIKNAGDAKYRSDASLLANQLVGQMLASNRTSLATLQASFQSPNGTAYIPWSSSVLATLPGAPATPPTVVIAQTASTSTGTPSNQATITISWNAPNEAAGAHSYITVAQIR